MFFLLHFFTSLLYFRYFFILRSSFFIYFLYLCRVNNIYHRDIIEILLECGREGLRIKNIARRIYNRHVDFFVHDVEYSEIRDNVGRYLWEQSRRNESPFLRTRYGTYAIKADFAIQLDLFLDISPRNEVHKATPQPIGGEYCPRHIQLELFT